MRARRQRGPHFDKPRARRRSPDDSRWLAVDLGRSSGARATLPSGAASGLTLDGATLRVGVGAGADAAFPRLANVALGCTGRAVVRIGGRAYVACGAEGVVVVSLDDPRGPALEGRIPTEGEAIGLFVLRGRPWVELARTEARPLEGATVLAAGAGVAPRAPSPLEAPQIPSERGSSPPPGASETKGTRMAPTREIDVFELSLGGAMFLTVGDLGVGGLGRSSLVRRFEAPIALHLDAAPFAFGTGKKGSAAVIAGTALVAIDTAFFEIGLGVGAAAIPGRVRYDSQTTTSLPTQEVTGRSTVVVPSLVRIGARDGLSFSVRTNVIVRDSLFAFGSIDVLGQIPIADRWALLLHGAGGDMGTADGDVTMRYRLTETRGSGAAFVTGGAGYAYVKGTPRCDLIVLGSSYTQCFSAEFHGPALTLAGEWRF